MGQSAEYKIILYGAGAIGKKVAGIFEKLNISAECLCDVDDGKHGLIYGGLTVKSIDEIKKTYEKGQYKLLFTLGAVNARKAKLFLIENKLFDETEFYGGGYEFYICNKFNSDKLQSDDEKITSAHINVSKNFIVLDKHEEEKLKEEVMRCLFPDENHLKTKQEQVDFDDHFMTRLEMYRTKMIPWLNGIHPLDGAKILQVGCGTGSGTIALCEQGARVTAIDISKDSLSFAKTRAELYRLTSPKFINLSAEDIGKINERFDLIIYTASMEHMTYSERINTIRAAYSMLDNNSHIVLYGIPNRLWYIDGHTSLEPFFNWIPDTLAVDYCKYTDRQGLKNAFGENANDDYEDRILSLIRWGRGVSYHEFEIALGREHLQVVSGLSDFSRDLQFFKLALILYGPDHVDYRFYDPDLNIAFKKI